MKRQFAVFLLALGGCLPGASAGSVPEGCAGIAAEVALGLHTCGFEIRSQIIWVKQHFAISRGAYHWRHEPCW